MSSKDRNVNTFELDKTITRINLHYIPAKIEANMDFDVEKKFSSRISKEDDGVLEMHFRGRPLSGRTIQLPSNFDGVIANSIQKAPGKDNSKENSGPQQRIVSDFTEYTYWNWDKKPTANDSHIRLLDWLKVSEVLHAPISAQEDP